MSETSVLRRRHVRYGFEATVEENPGRTHHVFAESQVQRGTVAGGWEYRERT